MINANGYEIVYHGNNGWSARAHGEELTIACTPNDRFGDGASIITMSGRVLAEPGREAIEAEIAAWWAAHDARRAAEARPAARNPYRSDLRDGIRCIGAAAYDNLRETLGDDLAAQMARAMQG